MTDVDSLTPEYILKENEDEIIIVIETPLSRPKDCNFVLKKDVFSFVSPPYRLKVKFPSSVSQNVRSQCYDKVTKTYKIIFKKCDTECYHVSDEDEENLNPVVCSNDGKPEKSDQNKKKQFYGFANMYSNLFGKFYGEFSEVVNLPDPDHTEVHKRKILREKEENEKWSDDHYLADTMETGHIESILNYKPPWIIEPVKKHYVENKRETLYQILDPKVNPNMDSLSKDNIRLSEFQIVEVLFCYAYNVRTTEGENTVESGWTINKLSSTLSWFDVFDDLKSVILACYKRSLTFPLYRNWNLAQMVHKDVVNLLKTDNVLQYLLEVREIFNESTNRYILNSLYIDDLCSFTLQFTYPRSLELAEELDKINIKKYEINPDLPLLEIAAYLTLEEEEEKEAEGSDEGGANVENIVDKIAGMKL